MTATPGLACARTAPASRTAFTGRIPLSSVLAELKRWWATGRSCFAELMEKLELGPPERSVLDQILPGPSG